MSIRQKYVETMGAIASGMMQMLALGHDEFTTDIQIRVGVDQAHVNTSALVELMIEKEVFTMEEYEVHLLKAAEYELNNWEEKLSELMGTDVKLS